jgi:hypothetical protein
MGRVLSVRWRSPSPFFSRLGFASPREKALSHQGRGDVESYDAGRGIPSPLVGEGFVPCERSELGTKGEGASP